MKKVIIILILLYSILSANTCPKLFRNFECNTINEYVKNVEIKDAVGQLFMVGINDNYINYENSTKITKLITNIGVGFVILNQYNYPPNLPPNNKKTVMSQTCISVKYPNQIQPY